MFKEGQLVKVIKATNTWGDTQDAIAKGILKLNNYYKIIQVGGLNRRDPNGKVIPGIQLQGTYPDGSPRNWWVAADCLLQEPKIKRNLPD